MTWFFMSRWHHRWSWWRHTDSTTAGKGLRRIGLAFVKDIVDMHGGQVQANSIIGEGSEFIVTLRTGFDHLPTTMLKNDNSGIEFKVLPSSVGQTVAHRIVNRTTRWNFEEISWNIWWKISNCIKNFWSVFLLRQSRTKTESVVAQPQQNNP